MWCTYDDGTVWPCEVLRRALWGRVVIRPISPAPDAGQERTVVASRIFS